MMTTQEKLSAAIKYMYSYFPKHLNNASALLEASEATGVPMHIIEKELKRRQQQLSHA